MKYSFLIPYHKRETFNETLDSFDRLYCGRSDYEVIVIESYATSQDQKSHQKLIEILEKHQKIAKKLEICDYYAGFNPSISFNIGARSSKSDFLIITNPESPHETDVLAGLDEEFSKKDCYVVCACRSILYDGSFEKWYQHSVHNNRRYHWCSAISRRNWLKINGFCESYQFGIGYDDDDLIRRIDMLRIPVAVRDDLIVKHLEHSRQHHRPDDEAINKKLFDYIWNR